jgi:hypothetical protein
MYVDIIITILDITFRPVLYLKDDVSELHYIFGIN